jgi:hypothetical protein
MAEGEGALARVDVAATARRHRLRWPGLVLGSIWTLPNTLLGLLLGAAGMARGALPRISDGAIVFHRYPWGPGGALTLGQVILHTGESLDVTCRTYAARAGLSPAEDCITVRLGDHERAHVYQYLLLGPLFLPLYAICGGVSAHNRFERAADRYAAGGGWWPWGF